MKNLNRNTQPLEKTNGAAKNGGNGSGDPARAEVLAEVTNIGPEYGFAEVLECLGAPAAGGRIPAAGEAIFLIVKACGALLNDHKGTWKIGSQVVFSVYPNRDPEKAKKTPWVSAYAHTSDPRSVRKTVTIEEKGEATGDRVAGERQARIAVLAAAWGEVDPQRTNEKAAKAATDVLAGLKSGDLNAADSAMGRLEARVAEIAGKLAIPKALQGIADKAAELLFGIPVAPAAEEPTE